MKRLFTLSLLLCTSIGVIAQDIPKELLKTWMPVLSTNYEGDTTSQEDLYFITFENKKGVIGFEDRAFSYEMLNDSINIEFDTDEVVKVALLELERERLVLSFDPSLIITYIPLPAFDLRKNINEVIESFIGEVWSFDIQTRYGTYNLDIDFSNILEDSALVRPEYLHIAKTAHALSIKDDPILWYITKKEEAVILKMEFIYSSVNELGNFLITDFKNDHIQFSYWEKGKEFHVQAKKWKKKSAHKQSKDIENLTRQAWRIEKEIIPKSKDSGFEAMLNQYFIEFEELHNEIDSTLFISQEDIDNHSLTLKFEETGAYKIYRESRVLDEGKWSIQFNNTIIQLNSDKEERLSDGVFGGFIEIKELKRNKLIIYRSFETRLNHQEERNESLWEIYKPVR
ncbi:hypothetical protein [Roseivirga seohaensis]|nr:hypothetical protein [Roseivirga seohaensis]